MHKEILFGRCLITASWSILIILLMFLDLCHTAAFAAPSVLDTMLVNSYLRKKLMKSENMMVF